MAKRKLELIIPHRKFLVSFKLVSIFCNSRFAVVACNRRRYCFPNDTNLYGISIHISPYTQMAPNYRPSSNPFLSRAPTRRYPLPSFQDGFTFPTIRVCFSTSCCREIDPVWAKKIRQTQQPLPIQTGVRSLKLRQSHYTRLPHHFLPQRPNLPNPKETRFRPIWFREEIRTAFWRSRNGFV